MANTGTSVNNSFKRTHTVLAASSPIKRIFSYYFFQTFTFLKRTRLSRYTTNLNLMNIFNVGVQTENIPLKGQTLPTCIRL